MTLFPEEIKVRRELLIKRQLKLTKEMNQLQEICPHVNATHINKANTGNYHPSCDSYWIDHRCPDCGKIWQTDQ
jgi:hypothetical protein